MRQKILNAFISLSLSKVEDLDASWLCQVTAASYVFGGPFRCLFKIVLLLSCFTGRRQKVIITLENIDREMREKRK